MCVIMPSQIRYEMEEKKQKEKSRRSTRKGRVLWNTLYMSRLELDNKKKKKQKKKLDLIYFKSILT